VTFSLTPVLAAILSASQPNPQPPPQPIPTTQSWWVTQGRACDGCPWRRPGHALLQSTYINVVYGLANLARGQVTARITPATWWDNMQHGWVWDLDDFVVNQLGHPYQGNNYFTSARANGLNFWESSAVTAFGSGTWEYFGETNKASLNDFINTTLGGIALGEVFHRTAWLMRDSGGSHRLSRELFATAVDPMTGINRFISGDYGNTTGKPPYALPSSLGGVVAAGALSRNDSAGDEWSTKPFVEINLRYGEPDTGRSRTPYDAFLVRLRFGGGSGFSEARVRGRLLGQPLKNGRFQVSVAQSYDFVKNGAYEFGAQGFDASAAIASTLSSRVTMRLVGWGGLTVLGAVDSVPLVAPAPVQTEQPESGQGISEGPRTFDYGPGSTYGGAAVFAHGERAFAVATIEGRHLFVVDGVRANHLLQRIRLDLLAPLRGTIRAGVTGEYLKRHTFYKDAAESKAVFGYTQISVYIAWGIS